MSKNIFLNQMKNILFFSENFVNIFQFFLKNVIIRYYLYESPRLIIFQVRIASTNYYFDNFQGV